jgi:hypothetical protein
MKNIKNEPSCEEITRIGGVKTGKLRSIRRISA